MLLIVEAVSELLARLAIVDCLLGDEERRNMEEAESGSVWESSLEAWEEAIEEKLSFLTACAIRLG